MSAAFRPRFRRRSHDAADDTHADASVAGAGDGGGERLDDAPGSDSGDSDEWLAYELHEWALESRVMLQQLLTVDQVVHSWQGTTLLVHESLEEQVDSLVEEVEEAERAKEAISRPIGPDDDLTAFEIGDWSSEMRDELVERLAQARVPHILEESTGEPADEGAVGGAVGGTGDEGAVGGAVGGTGDEGAVGDAVGGTGDEGAVGDADEGPGWDLWVRETDEERVDLVVDDLMARVEEASFDELDGLEVNDLLSDLFVACDRLRRDPRDPDGIRGAATGAGRIARVRTPYGFSAPNWRSLREAAGVLLALMEVEDTDEDELRDLARQLSDTLRMLI